MKQAISSLHGSWPVVLSLAALAGVSACGGGSLVGTGGGGGSGGSGAGGAPAQTGVPCAVAEVIAGKCLSCHSDPPSSGAPMSLVTYSDLTAQSSSHPGETQIQRCVARMSAATAPMPPSGGATADEIAALQAWIDAGTPSEECTAVVDPFSLPVTCTSGETWNPPGENEGPLMNPGQACIQCHKNANEPGIPIFAVAGTVYPTGHEPDNCLGASPADPAFSDVIVRVTDANGLDHDLKPNSSGNFMLEAPSFPTPYTAKVVSSKGERAMSTAQTSGDCNLCHTQDGAGNGSTAPGRIVVPY